VRLDCVGRFEAIRVGGISGFVFRSGASFGKLLNALATPCFGEAGCTEGTASLAKFSINRSIARRLTSSGKSLNRTVLPVVFFATLCALALAVAVVLAGDNLVLAGIVLADVVLAGVALAGAAAATD
jgi:hypothetical protein